MPAGDCSLASASLVVLDAGGSGMFFTADTLCCCPACTQYIFWDVMSPSDLPRLSWDLWMFTLMVYVVVVVPYLVAFNVPTVSQLQ